MAPLTVDKQTCSCGYYIALYGCITSCGMLNDNMQSLVPILSIHLHFDLFVLLPMAIITFICDCTTTRFSSFYNSGLQVVESVSYSYPCSLSCMHKGQERTLLAHYDMI